MQDFRGLSRQVWHQRYLAQAGWTHHIRQHIFKIINTQPGETIIEIGSGTSAVLQALQTEGFFNLTGIDIDFASLSFSKASLDRFHLAQADGLRLPFSKNAFGVTFCHYLLMWIDNPKQILDEMRRVTRPDGWILALAEPDHQSRIDYPSPLDELGEIQTQALKSQGVDVNMGRKLRSLFHQTGLIDVEVGILGAQWNETNDLTWYQTEWTMIRADLKDQPSAEKLLKYQNRDQQARQTGARILYIPTFYALGRKK